MIMVNQLNRKNPNAMQMLLLKLCIVWMKRLKEKTDIAVIAGYLAQVTLLKKKIKKEKFKNLKIDNGTIGTVDKFQGS